jgi:NPCBM/NEW2 domain/Domain of unknown function (DUF1929)/Kelch motif
MNSSAFPRASNRLKSRPPWLALLAAGLLSGCGSTPQPLENPYLTQSHPWVDGGAQLTATLTSGFLSDQQWDSATNGWGPVERDRSNAESVAGDGRVMTINGQTFTKGLGAHAVSEITYSLAGNCSSFLATVGVDDEVDIQNRWGTVSFEVYGDTTKLFDSGVMSGTSPAQNISVNLMGRQSLRLVVTNGGDNVYYDHGDWAEARVTCGALNPVAAFGRWDTPIAWPVVAVHASLLPNGKIITWNAGEQPTQVTKADLFDPVNGLHTPVPVNTANLFCSGHTLLPDGRLLVVGGHLVNNGEGIAQTNLFDYRDNSWTRAQDMNAARWYPSVITLGSGEALVASGSITPNTFNEIPQVWGSQTTGWRDLGGAQARLSYYPWIFQAPDGRVFNSGPSTAMGWMTTTGAGTEVYAGNRDAVNYREYGSSVMYQPGKLLVLGGSDPPVASTVKIDLNQNAKLEAGPNMGVARRQLNATILPDGTVLVTGGTSGTGFNNEASAVRSAELWNPSTNTFRTLSSMQVARIYHSTAVLQTDGRVLSMGGGLGGGGIDHSDAEYFNPPYLFNPDGTTAARPSISSAPATIGYNQAFTLGTTNATSISRVTLLRLTSVTHAFNMNQRFMDLGFSKASNGLSVTSPVNENIAPPGHYLLSILNGNGVPSVSKVVQILAGTTTPNTNCAPPAAPSNVADRMTSLNATLWTYSSNQSVVSQCGTNVVKNTGTGTDFAATFLRKVALPGGSSVSMQFKLEGLAGDAYFSLASSGATYQRFGIVELGGALYGQGYLGDGNYIGVPLTGNLKADTWYEIKFNTTGPLFTLEVRERGLGTPIASFSKAMGSGRTWYFQHWLNQGSAYFANYAETSSGTGATGVGTPGSLYRAINLNGPSLIFEGKTFEASEQAADLVAGPYSFTDERVALIPAVTDVNKAKMLHSSIFGYGTVGGQVKLSNVATGKYNVYLYAWEDNLNETFSLKLNGQIVESNYQSGPAGTWRKLGPYPINVTAGSIEMSSSGGAANFSGLEVYRR